MFRCKITLRRPEDTANEMKRFQSSLSRSGLPTAASEALWSQVMTALQQFEDQMTLRYMKALSADRVFEGDDYRVVISVRQGPIGVISKIANLFRG